MDRDRVSLSVSDGAGGEVDVADTSEVFGVPTLSASSTGSAELSETSAARNPVLKGKNIITCLCLSHQTKNL